MTVKKITLVAAAGLSTAALLAGCSQSPAEVASANISNAADKFEIAREITTINNITGDFLQVIRGRCNINATTEQLEVTCQSPMGIVKNFTGLNMVTTYKVDQLDPAQVSVDQYKVTVNPSTLIPDVDVK